MCDSDRLDAVAGAATVALAWTAPLLAALPITFGLTVLVNAELQLVPAGRERAIFYLATAYAGTVAVGGNLLLGQHVAHSLAEPVSA